MFLFKQKTAYELRISDWSSDVCSSDLLDAVEAGERDADRFRPGALDVLAQHVMALACAAPFREDELLAEIRTAAPYRWIDAALFTRLLGFVRDGGYALQSYDRFQLGRASCRARVC